MDGSHTPGAASPPPRYDRGLEVPLGVHFPRVVLIDRRDDTELATVPIPSGATVYDAFDRMGKRLPTRCRGSSMCGLCRVEVVSGQAEPAEVAPDERLLLDRVAPDELEARLACRLRPAPGEERLVVSMDGARWPHDRPAE